MKDNFGSLVLTGVLMFFVLLTATLSFSYIHFMGRLQGLQAQTAQVNNNLAMMNSLASEAMKYSERNPAIVSILQSVGAKPGGQPSPAQPKK